MLRLLSGPLGLPVGFLLLWHSVLCTVESLSLLFLLLYIDLYVFGELGVFHANRTSMSQPWLNLRFSLALTICVS